MSVPNLIFSVLTFLQRLVLESLILHSVLNYWLFAAFPPFSPLLGLSVMNLLVSSFLCEVVFLVKPEGCSVKGLAL